MLQRGLGTATGNRCRLLACRAQRAHRRTATTIVSATADLSGPSTSATTQSVTAVDDFRADKRPVILYDGVCNLCNGAVDFMLEWDKTGKFRMAALQSSAGERLLRRCGREGDISSIVVVEEHTHHIRSDAILRIARDITNPWPLFALLGYPVPGPFRDFLYDQVADNRYSFLGKRTECRLSNAGYEDRFLVE